MSPPDQLHFGGGPQRNLLSLLNEQCLQISTDNYFKCLLDFILFLIKGIYFISL